MLNSLRLRLLLILVLTLSFSISLSSLFSYHEAQHEIQELFDAQLAQEARIIATSIAPGLTVKDYAALQQKLDQSAHLIPNESGEEDDKGSKYGHVYERKIAFQIWDKKHKPVLHSLSAPGQPLAPAGLSSKAQGYHDVMRENKKWRVFSLWDRQGKYIIQTGEKYEIRDELAREISLNWVMLTGLMLPVIILLVLLAIHYGFAPLRSIVNQIAQRDPNHLEPIHSNNTPNEIRPLVDELNKLFTRVSLTLDKERRFTNDAAHELRTPIAALKTQAQVALRSQDTEQRHTALQHIITSVDRLSHLLEQLLRLARLGVGEVKLSFQPTSLYAFTREIVSELVPMAVEKNIDLEILNEHDPGLVIMAEDTALTMLLRNILDNAIRYTPPHGKISVQLAQQSNSPVLCITDTGPGIAPELHHRVFDRFYRISGSGESGCGLGLSIAKQCADLLNANIALNQAAQGRGLKVCIRFLNAD